MFEIKLQKRLTPTFEVKVTFTAKPGEITTLIGKSGAGKSTILNLISGLMEMDTGWIKSLEDDYTFVPIHQRRFGYVQQQPMLFPHLNVEENLTYSNQLVGLEELVEVFELKPHLKKRVQALSGGEAQRVSLVRTLLSRPKLLLLDEAFSALDSLLRAKLCKYLKGFEIPIVFVTHDLQEAYELSDYIIFLEAGEIVEQGTCWDVFHQCRRKRTAAFIGIENILPLEKIKCYLPGCHSSQLVAVAGNQISLEKDGFLSTLKRVTKQKDAVKLELDIGLIVKVAWREYKGWQVGDTVHFKIHDFICLEDV